MKSPDQNWKIYSQNLLSVIHAACSFGAKKENILLSANIDAKSLLDLDNQVPLATLIKLYEVVDKDYNLPDIGIYTGRINQINRFNILLYSLSVRGEMRHYLNFIPSFLRFSGDIGEVSVVKDKDTIGLQWKPLWEPTSKQRYLTDEVLSFACFVANSVCVKPILPVKVHFSYQEPSDTSLLKSTFGTNLFFDMPFSCIYYDYECLNYPLIQLHSDEVILSLNPSIKQMFNTGESGDEFIVEFRKTLLRLLPTAQMTIDRTAGKLNISRRTLQRRLESRNTQFQQELHKLRSELAVVYLSDKRMSVMDISLMLGYNDQASFSVAFKSWYGKSPRDFRNV